MADLTPGRLLVANPLLPDSNFDRSVVLVLGHGEEGALGVVLNRPGPSGLDASLGGWQALVSPPSVIFVGGPVNRNAFICVARLAADLPARSWSDQEGWSPVAGDLGTLDLEGDPAVIGPRMAAIRVFSGYAGWGPGQLEGEIDADAWWVLAAEPGDVFGPDPDRLWTEVLRRQRGPLQLVSSFPEHPSSN